MTKTRELLVTVARQLFARRGFEATTMNDIALESKKGRRTLYTYFKSKQEVYDAVIDGELNYLLGVLNRVKEERCSADTKLKRFFANRMETVKEIVRRNGHLRANFFRDVVKVESVRRQYNHEEYMILRSILMDGRNDGIFQIENIDATALFLQYALQGMDVPYIKGFQNSRGITKEAIERNMFMIVFHGIIK